MIVDVLSAAELKRLTEHKYSVEGTSYLDPFMQKFWRWVVEKVPLSWAPNSITLVGLIINMVTTCILMIYSPDARQEVPSWAYFLAALGLFAYQTLDAIDGKQARRTKSSTPLGELFDHGCDSLSTVFVVIGSMIATKFGQLPGWMFFECFSGMFMFYLAHWQTYVSGTLKFGKIDVTEGQFSIMGLYILSGLLGEDIWANTVPVLGVQIRMFPIYFSIFAAFLIARVNFRVIFMEGGQGKNGSTVAGTSVLSPVLPITIVIVAAYTIYKMSTSALFESNTCLYVLSFGMAASKVTNRLVVAHMTRSEMDLFDTVLIGPGMLFLNQYFGTPIPEYIVLWMCFFYCTGDLLRYAVSVCIQICDYLNIYCFKITVPTEVLQHNNGVSSSVSDAHGDSPAFNTRTKSKVQ